MNHIYRVIYNKTTGKMVVVSEKTKSQGKGKNKGSLTTIGSEILSQKSSQIKKPTASIYSILTICISSIALAETSNATQIIADKNATKQEQAVILKTANGLTQINIQTPSQSGVSKNKYSQFDVGQQGAILNNSRKHVKTELAGFVEGNPHLARGEAKVILNQVNSNNPSQLKGYVEVAGKRAEVVIANPSGIQIDGGGFINAQGAVLTTGQAQFDAQGNITHYHIANGQQGKIQIDGQGLNANGADYTKLISQYNQLNAHVIAGQGDVEVQTGTSLDVSKLGGMYAGKIRLVGTEKGLGVTQATAFNTNNAGIVSAKESLTLDSQGNLVNTGTLASEQQLDLNVNKLSNETGQIIANQADIRLQQDYTHSDAKQIQANALSLSTQGKLTNTQHLTSNDKLVLQAKQIENQGVINSQQTTLQVSETIDNLGAKIYGTQLQIDAKTLNNRPHKKGDEVSHTAPIIAGRETVNIQVETLNNQANPDRAGKFNSDFNHQSLILSEGTLNITANTVNNIGASIESAGDMRISAQTLNNKNADFKIDPLVELSRTEKTLYQPEKSTDWYDESEVRFGRWGYRSRFHDLLITPTGKEYIKYFKKYYEEVHLKDEVSSSDPSRIISGTKLTLLGKTHTNQDSVIIAGGQLQSKDDQQQVEELNNQATSGTEKIVQEDSIIQPYTVGRGWYSRKRRDKRTFGQKIAEPDITLNEKTISLPILQHESQQSLTTATGAQIVSVDNLNISNTLKDRRFTPSKGADYLIETDPVLTNGKAWLGSDYMLKRLQSDPNHIHKRLSDGYHEQELIKDQIFKLTGQYKLGDYRTNDEQYQSLMDNGIATAKQLNLRTGVALTNEQIAELTTDIVWLVEQIVNINGKQQTVLVPKVYVRRNKNEVKLDGALISAQNMDMNLAGKLNNEGNLVAKNQLHITANTVNNSKGGEIKSDFVKINTESNLNNIGGTLQANNTMNLEIGGNLVNSSSTYHQTSQQGQSNSERTGIDQVGKIFVGNDLKDKTDQNGNKLTTLSINADGNITFNAGVLQNVGNTQLIAKGDVQLNSIKTGYQSNAIGDNNNYHKQGKTQDVGSVILSDGNTLIQGNNITGEATRIQSTGNTTIKAQNDIKFKDGRQTNNLSTAYRISDKDLLSKQTTQDYYQLESDQTIANHIDGDQVIMTAKKDMHLIATNIIGEHGADIQAGNDLTLDTTKNSQKTNHSHYSKESGVFGNGSSLTIGKQQHQEQDTETQTNHTGTTIEIKNGNIVLSAGNHYQQTNSHIKANNPTDNIQDLDKGILTINAKTATIENSTATKDTYNVQQQKTSGLTISISNSLVDQAKGIQSLATATEEVNDDRSKVMGSLSLLGKARTLTDNGKKAIQHVNDNNTYDQNGQINGQKDTLDKLKGLGTTRIQAAIGSQKSQSNSHSYSQTNEASQINVNNLVLNIQGAGKDSDLTVIGSDLTIGNNLYNNIEGDIHYQASTQTSFNHSDNKAKGFGVGVFVDSQGNKGITANANKSKGHGDGETITHSNSHITVGNAIQQKIKGNLILDGATLKAQHMTGEVDGDLLVTSRQDTQTYDAKQKNIGFSADLSWKGIPQNISINGGKSNLNGNSAQITEQSGIALQTSNVVIGGKGEFEGGYFTTKDEKSNHTVFKQGVITKDIENHSDLDGKSLSVGVSVGATNKPTISGIGYGNVDEHDRSTTYSAVTGVAGKKEVTTDTLASLNEKTQSLDTASAQKQLDLQNRISGEFGREVPKMVGDYADKFTKDYKNTKERIDILNQLLAKETDVENISKLSQNLEKELEILASLQKDYDNWKEGGIYRVALHTATGLLATGAVEGALTTGGVATIAPKLNEWQDKLTTKLVEKGFEKDTAESVSKFTLNLAIATAGTTAGLDTSSTAYALNADMNNRQLHPDEKKLATKLAQELKKPKYKSFVRPDGQPYTLEDVENALRWANINSTKYKEKYTDNIKVVLKEGTNANTLMYDEYGWSKPSVEGSSVVYYQHLNTAKRPNEQLISFIQAHTPKGTKYTWDNNARIPYMPTSLPKKPTTTPSSPVKKVVEAPKYPQTALDRQNETIKRTGIDFNGGKVAQSKSEKIINEQVMPVVQTGVGLAEVGTGTAMCATGVGCGVGAALIIHGSDNAVTGNANQGKTTNQQTSSVLLTQGVGLSEGTASNIKMGTDLALGGATAAQGLGRRVTTGSSGTATHGIPQSVINKAKIENNVNVDNPYQNYTADGRGDIPKHDMVTFDVPRTIYPNKRDIQQLVDEHSKSGAKLTFESAEVILQATAPSGSIVKIAGDNVAGPDVITISSYDRITQLKTIQVKASTGSSRAFENQVRNDLDKAIGEGGSDIIAVQVPANSQASDINHIKGKLGNFSKDKVGDRKIIVVDELGNVIIPLQNLRNFSKK